MYIPLQQLFATLFLLAVGVHAGSEAAAHADVDVADCGTGGVSPARNATNARLAPTLSIPSSRRTA
jgi:hypothetical protein